MSIEPIDRKRHMSNPMKLDEFLSSQSSRSEAFTATVEPIADNATDVKITPFHEGGGCGCSSSFTLAKKMIRSVKPTGNFHRCCGKRLEIVEIEFEEDASVPVADLMKRAARAGGEMHAGMPHGIPQGMPQGVPHEATPYPMPGGGFSPYGARASARRGSGLVGRWPIPWTDCEIVCIEVCTRFCGPTGWACCEWETRCGINCNGLTAF
jgi:hypothetical protein